MKNSYPLLIVAFYLYSLNIQAQTIKGLIIDQTSKMPLSFSTIEFKKASTGTYADTLGYFSLNIPEKYVNDSIEIYAIGYEKKKIPIKLFLKNNTEKIELSRKDFIIKEVKVKPKNSKLVTLGTRAKKPWRYQIANVFGSQIGHYIRNDKNIEGFVKSVSFYIAGVGHTDTPFRVRIYKFDKKNNCPGEDLLNSNLIVQNTKGEGWFTVDISEYFIRFPKEGMFVAMEWIYTNDKYYYSHEISVKGKDGTLKKIKDKFYGLSLGNLQKQKEISTWSKGFGNDWHIWDHYYKGYINAMINTEIEKEY